MRASPLVLLTLLLAACAPDTETACGDGVDEDKDGKTDCADSDCTDADACVDDADGDRFTELDGDCDDSDYEINPGATEYCDGIDNDCDGLIDDQDPGTQNQDTWYLDADGDGWGLEDDTEEACDPPGSYAAAFGDCDDADAAAFPGAAEVEDAEACMRDADGDGWGDEFPEVAGVDAGTDCDDDAATTNPDQTETWYDGVDADCDGWNDYDQDHDGDRTPDGGGADCDDLDDEVNTDDDDGDGYHPCGGDCNDDDPAIMPGVFELTDGVDNDCDGELDYTGLANADARLLGIAAGDWAGAAVSAFTDLDGDGFDDLLVGASEQGSGGAGTIYLVPGPVSGDVSLSDASALIVGESAGGLAGAAITPAGDVDGDGVLDLFVGAPTADYRGTDAGAAYLLLGPISSGSLASADRRFAGETIEDRAGTRIAAGGDVDGDGQDDLLIGAPYAESASQGAAYLLLDAAGSSTSMGLENASLILRGELSGDEAGWGAALAGDMNGDGLSDVAVGAPETAAGGTVYVLYGDADPTGDLAGADLTITGLAAGDRAGACVAYADDVDWDGHTDLLVGAPGVGDGAGAVYLFLGPLDATMTMAEAGATFSGVAAGDGAGTWVTGAGSIDGDSYDDMLVGIAPGSDADPVLVRGPIWGSSSLADADGIYVAESSGDDAGVSIAAAGDSNGDGFIDLLVGAPTYGETASEAGAAYLIYGGPELYEP
jgi:hypothetical protein